MKLSDRKTITVAELIAKLQAMPPDYVVWARVKGPNRGGPGNRVGGGATGPIKSVEADHGDRIVDLLGIEEA
jgi:hypothetical protein